MHWVYQLLSYLVFGSLLPFLHMFPKLRSGWRERLGFNEIPAIPKRRIWFHGASAGDILAIKPMITLLHEQDPDVAIVVSTITNSGAAIAKQHLRDVVERVRYLPIDLPGATRRALKAVQPNVLVLEYAEHWPNLVHAAHRLGVRVILTNGRLSENLLSRYRLLFALIGNPFRKMYALLMRTTEECERAVMLGAPPNICRVTGNTKFDGAQAVYDADKIQKLGAQFHLHTDTTLLVAGSTHEGEEEIILEVFRRLRTHLPALRLLLAPRYAERGLRVIALAETFGFSVQRRRDVSNIAADILILDTIGELSAAYAWASLVFVGGSFIKRGGQNILEPASLAKPVLFGPFMGNFRDSVEVLLGRGGIQVEDGEQLFQISLELLSRPDELFRLGQMAKEAVSRVEGASTRNVEILRQALRAAPLI